MVALVNYMSQILVELVKLANLIISVNKAVACGNRIQEIFEVQPGLVEADTAIPVGNMDGVDDREEILRFDHVEFTYPGAKEPSLTDIDLSIKKGEVIGVIGGTGSGKTSLVHLIPRYYDATKGHIYLAGKEISVYALKELRDRVRVVLQKSVLFEGTIRSNLLWGKKDASEDELWRALSIAQAKEVVEKKADGLEEAVEQGGRNFSGGQKQRLAIARALVGDPKILVLDDSSSALDYATDAALRKAIATQLQGLTLFIVSQRAASVRGADRILVLDDGKIVDIGTHDELLARCPVYQEIYESQYGKEEQA